MALWLRADLGVSHTTGSVDTWADQSGNARNLTGSLTARPTLQTGIVNGHPVIRFDGSNDQLLSGNFTVTAAQHVFVVLRNAAGNTDLDTVWYTDNDANSTTPSRLTWRTGPIMEYDANGQVGSAASLADSTWALVTVLAGAGTGSTLAINNGTPVTDASNMGTGTWDGIVLGSRFSDRFWAGDIAEVVVYSGAKSGADLTAIQTYFNSRYALW